MKYREILLEQLKLLPYFNKETISQIGKQYGLKSTTVDSYISRSLARKDLIPLKNGLYISADFYHKNKSDISYSFYLANVLRTPSYISTWAALQYYNLVTEMVQAVTSVTLKITKNYATKAGSFEYHSIKKELFSDFSLVKGKFDFFLASPSKALFDLLYFKTRQFRGVKLEAMDALIGELRIDVDEMDKKERNKLYAMIKESISHE
jgi:predicted transcriptional regulator of viral defense system